jgi:hypothetical protein
MGSTGAVMYPEFPHGKMLRYPTNEIVPPRKYLTPNSIQHPEMVNGSFYHACSRSPQPQFELGHAYSGKYYAS